MKDTRGMRPALRLSATSITTAASRGLGARPMNPSSSLAALAHPTHRRSHLQAGHCFPCEADASIRLSETLAPEELQACPPGIASRDGRGGADASVDGPSTLIWLGLRR